MLLTALVSGVRADADPVAAPRPGSSATIDPYTSFVSEASQRFAIPADWIRAVMRVESASQAHAASPKGAMGLMQIMPQTWADLRVRYVLGGDPFDPRENILGGAAYLRQLYDRYGAAGFLAAYNAGPQRYDAYLAGRQELPRETKEYLAEVTSEIRGSSFEHPMFVRATVPSPFGSPMFVAPIGVRPSPQITGTSQALVPQSARLFVAISRLQR